MARPRSRSSAPSFTFKILKGEDGYYIGYCVEIPGCASQGRTIRETQENLVEALQATLEVLARREARRTVPRPTGHPVKTTKVELIAQVA